MAACVKVGKKTIIKGNKKEKDDNKNKQLSNDGGGGVDFRGGEVSILSYGGLFFFQRCIYTEQGFRFSRSRPYEVLLPRLDNLCLFCGPHFPTPSAPFEEQTTRLLLVLDVLSQAYLVFAPLQCFFLNYPWWVDF